jgi:N6-L-threonylcarbamoyladenine synthase
MKKTLISLGMEGSANKFFKIYFKQKLRLAIGVVTSDGSILSNLRHTYITPPGEGFKPTETAQHHREYILDMVQNAMDAAKVTPKDLDCISYTKGFVKFFFHFFKDLVFFHLF